MRITWLSQGGFLFEEGGKRVVVDPYLSNDLKKLGHDRMTPPPLSFDELRPDVVIFTHDHLDHYDPITVGEILSRYKSCKFVGTTSTRNHHLKLGYDCSDFVRLDLCDSFEYGGLKFLATYAYHSEPCAIGLIVSDKNTTAYLSGDTLYDENLSKQIAEACDGKTIDLAMVCINGKLGNMSWRDAVKLVCELKPKAAMPMHYGLFADNTVDPSGFVANIRKANISPIVPQAGVPFKI